MRAPNEKKRVTGAAAERPHLRLAYEAETETHRRLREACRRLGSYLHWQSVKDDIASEYAGGW